MPLVTPAHERAATSFQSIQARDGVVKDSGDGQPERVGWASLSRLDTAVLAVQVMGCVVNAAGEFYIAASIPPDKACEGRVCRLGPLWELGPGVPCQWAPPGAAPEVASSLTVDATAQLMLLKAASMVAVAMCVLISVIPFVSGSSPLRRREGIITAVGAVSTLVLAVPTIVGYGTYGATGRPEDNYDLIRSVGVHTPPLCAPLTWGIGASGFVANFLYSALSVATLLLSGGAGQQLVVARADAALLRRLPLCRTCTRSSRRTRPSMGPIRHRRTFVPPGARGPPDYCWCRRARRAYRELVALPGLGLDGFAAIAAASVFNGYTVVGMFVEYIGWTDPEPADGHARWSLDDVARGAALTEIDRARAILVPALGILAGLSLAWAVRVATLASSPDITEAFWRGRSWIAPPKSAVILGAYCLIEALRVLLLPAPGLGAFCLWYVVATLCLILPVTAVVVSNLAAQHSVNAATSKLRAAEATLRSFILWSNHELRTLLTPVLLVSEELVDMADAEAGPGDSALASLSASIRESSSRASALLTSVLDYFRAITTGRKASPPCSWEPAGPALRRAITVGFGGDGRVLVETGPSLDAAEVFTGMDAVLLATANFVTNALKFRQEGSPVRVRADLSVSEDSFVVVGPSGSETQSGEEMEVLESGGEREGAPPAVAVERGRFGASDLVIEVEDDGPGVRREKQPSLFRAFADAGTEAVGAVSTGVGLELVRESIARLGGEVGYRLAQEPRAGESHGRGSVFWMSVPVAVRRVRRNGDDAAGFLASPKDLTDDGSQSLGDESAPTGDGSGSGAWGLGGGTTSAAAGALDTYGRGHRADLSPTAAVLAGHADGTRDATARRVSAERGVVAGMALVDGYGATKSGSASSAAAATPSALTLRAPLVGPSEAAGGLVVVSGLGAALAAQASPPSIAPAAARRSSAGQTRSLSCEPQTSGDPETADQPPSPALLRGTTTTATATATTSKRARAERDARRQARRQRGAAAAAPAAPAAAPAAPRPRVLVVDDSSAIRDSLGRALGRLGFDAVKAADGGEGLARLLDACGEGSVAPVAVLLDREMPVVSGLEMLRRLGSEAGPAGAAAREVPVVLVTGSMDEGLEAEAASLGAREVVRKPLTRAGLREALRRAGVEVS